LANEICTPCCQAALDPYPVWQQDVRMGLVCPHCHKLIGQQRAGIHMSPAKAALFDRLRAAGDLGISAQELADGFYRGRKTRNCVSQHLKQLADLLEETAWEVACEGRSRAARRYLRRRGK
jgi:hypothetical protein